MLTEVNTGVPTVLEEFQIAYLLDDRPYKVSNKTRQAGGSLVVSMAKFWKAYRNEGFRCDIVSINLKEAKGKITYIRNLWESLPLKWRHPLALDNAHSIGFHLGRRRSEVNSLAASSGIRGGKKDVVFDEAAHIPGFDDLFVAALPATVRDKGGFDVVSTPLGQQGKFFEIYSNHDELYTDWARHAFIWIDVNAFCNNKEQAREIFATDFGSNLRFITASTDFFEEYATPDLKRIAASFTEEQFLQEFCGDFVDESTAFYPHDLINKCRKQTEPQHDGDKDYFDVWLQGRPEENDQPVFMGIDFAEGRKGGDSTSIQILEKNKKDILVQRFYKDLDSSNGFDDFDKQLNYISKLIHLYKPQVVRCDETGLGRKLSADLKKLHGTRIEPVTFTNVNKEEMALGLKSLMEQGKLYLQWDNKAIAGQIHNIKRKLTIAGNIQYSGEPHDDMFWALALAAKGQGKRGFRIITLD